MRQEENTGTYMEELYVTNRVTTMLVCIKGQSEDGVYGEVYSYYLTEPVMFTGAGDLVLKLDEICGWLGTPRRTVDPRFLNREMERRYYEAGARHPDVTEDRIQERHRMADFPGILKAKEVLVVNVRFRQNASIQGSIKGKLTKGESVNFRSAMELMRMMRMIRL